MAAALARGLARGPDERLGPASWVTLARATLAVGVAALAADSFTHDTPVALLVTLAAVALALDAVDGWVARRTGTATALGARFDGEVDAFLILALSVYVAPAYGAWVLAIGAARYVFLAGEWLLPWMRAPLPPRRWRRVVAATQGVVLTVAAAGVLPRALTQALLVAALVLLAASIGECAWWLWRRRHEAHARPAAGAARAAAHGHRRGAHGPRPAARLGRPRRAEPAEPPHARRVRAAPAGVPRRRRVAVVLPPAPRRVLAVVAGSVLSVLVLVRGPTSGSSRRSTGRSSPLTTRATWGSASRRCATRVGVLERGDHRRPQHPGRGGRPRTRVTRQQREYRGRQSHERVHHHHGPA